MNSAESKQSEVWGLVGWGKRKVNSFSPPTSFVFTLTLFPVNHNIFFAPKCHGKDLLWTGSEGFSQASLNLTPAILSLKNTHKIKTPYIKLLQTVLLHVLYLLITLSFCTACL